MRRHLILSLLLALFALTPQAFACVPQAQSCCAAGSPCQGQHAAADVICCSAASVGTKSAPATAICKKEFRPARQPSGNAASPASDVMIVGQLQLPAIIERIDHRFAAAFAYHGLLTYLNTGRLRL